MAGRMYAKVRQHAGSGAPWMDVGQLRAELEPYCDIQAFELALRKPQFQLMRRDGRDFLRIFRRRR